MLRDLERKSSKNIFKNFHENPFEDGGLRSVNSRISGYISSTSLPVNSTDI